MTIARKQIIVDGEIRSYHCSNRCVRRAFLCGYDYLTGKNFEHRRGWVKDRLVFLSGIFVLDVVSHSVQSNHLHVILRTRPDLVEAISDEEVASRWLRLYPPSAFKDEPNWIPSEILIASILRNPERVKVYRRRLNDVSWFMRNLDERIARMANREDQCTGRFWESRFKSKALLDEPALLTCMVYVDLNPIRAGETQTPEESRFTSGYDRIRAFRADTKLRQMESVSEPKSEQTTESSEPTLPLEPTKPTAELIEEQKAADWLCPLNNTPARKGIFQEITLKDYLYILDMLGREVRPGKKGSIPMNLEPILQRLSIEPGHWLATIEAYEGVFRRILGRANRVMEQAKEVGLKWFQGIRACREVFGC